MEYFKSIKFRNFWESSKYAYDNYEEQPLTNELIRQVESELGYKLPDSYIELMKHQNGGIPKATHFATLSSISGVDKVFSIEGIMGIGYNKPCSLLGELGSPYLQKERGLPEWGLCICETDNWNDAVVMLDYRKDGEPEVILVEPEEEYRILFLARDFESFINGLLPIAEINYSQTKEIDNKNLEEVLEYWHKKNAHRRIISTIYTLPAKKIDFHMKMFLGRAFNNIAEPEEGIRILKSIEKEGKDNGLWNYRLGYAYLFTNQPDLSLPCLEKARRLDPMISGLDSLIKQVKEVIKERG
ncbi:MAG: SMI1/KNR4 family protein [Tannerellaceae bacterium]|nr:SMI1/KNR4 family protein [Tannerellaceae bacterium]